MAEQPRRRPQPDQPEITPTRASNVRVSQLEGNRVQVEFQIDDLISRLLHRGSSAAGHCGGCNGCGGCSH